MRRRQPAQQVRQPQTTASARRRGRDARVDTSGRALPSCHERKKAQRAAACARRRNSYGRQKAPSHRQLPYRTARGGASRYEAEHACLAWETRELSQQHVSKVRDAVDYTRLDRGW